MSDLFQISDVVLTRPKNNIPQAVEYRWEEIEVDKGTGFRDSLRTILVNHAGSLMKFGSSLPLYDSDRTSGVLSTSDEVGIGTAKFTYIKGDEIEALIAATPAETHLPQDAVYARIVRYQMLDGTEQEAIVFATSDGASQLRKDVPAKHSGYMASIAAEVAVEDAIFQICKNRDIDMSRIILAIQQEWQERDNQGQNCHMGAVTLNLGVYFAAKGDEPGKLFMKTLSSQKDNGPFLHTTRNELDEVYTLGSNNKVFIKPNSNPDELATQVVQDASTIKQGHEFGIGSDGVIDNGNPDDKSLILIRNKRKKLPLK